MLIIIQEAHPSLLFRWNLEHETAKAGVIWLPPARSTRRGVPSSCFPASSKMPQTPRCTAPLMIGTHPVPDQADDAMLQSSEPLLKFAGSCTLDLLIVCL